MMGCKLETSYTHRKCFVRSGMKGFFQTKPEIDLLKIIRNFLSNRKQMVMLTGQIATWTSFNARVSEGST